MRSGRIFRAYWVTFRILCKYLALSALKHAISESRAHQLQMSAHTKTARQIVSAILELKGLYIKMGQTLSIMSNFLPESFTEGLEQLQDAVPPHPYSEVEKRFQADFGKSPKEIFDRFEETPIASASLGQVHVAYKDGIKFAVKLQYPDIDEICQTDLKTVGRIFGMFNFIFPNYGFERIYEDISKMILEELDYQTEGKHLETIRNNFKDKPEYVFPKVFWEMSSKKILTAEFIEGIKVSNLGALKQAGIDPHDVAIALIHSYCQQVFIDGVFHADPHPGNILVKTEGIIQEGQKNKVLIAMVDFGATATIRPEMRSGMTLFVEALIKKDTKLIALALKQMGFIAKEENEEAIDKIIDYFYGKIRGIKIENFKQLNIKDFQNLGDILELKKMDVSFRDLMTSFHVPKDWILIERTLLLMMGLVSHLDPYLNPVEIILPYVEKFVLGKDKTAADLLIETAREVLLSYINLPNEIHKALRKLQEGKIVTRNKSVESQTRALKQATLQIVYTLLLVSSIGLGYVLSRDGEVFLAERIKWVSGLLGILLTWSLLRNK